MTSKSPRKIKAFSAAQIRAIDQKAIKRYGIPSLLLMENAGRAVAEEVLRQLKIQKQKRVSILCGSGNNAGDGFVAARYLMQAGVSVDVLICGARTAWKNDPRINFKILKNLNAAIHYAKRLNQRFKKFIDRSAIVVDALFGVGLNRAIDEPLGSIIDFINGAQKSIVAVDIPSGLDATTGDVRGHCIKAGTTVTFSTAKSGFYKKAGPCYAGRIKVVPIGIPKQLLK